MNNFEEYWRVNNASIVYWYNAFKAVNAQDQILTVVSASPDYDNSNIVEILFITTGGTVSTVMIDLRDYDNFALSLVK